MHIGINWEMQVKLSTHLRTPVPARRLPVSSSITHRVSEAVCFHTSPNARMHTACVCSTNVCACARCVCVCGWACSHTLSYISRLQAHHLPTHAQHPYMCLIVPMSLCVRTLVCVSHTFAHACICASTRLSTHARMHTARFQCVCACKLFEASKCVFA